MNAAKNARLTICSIFIGHSEGYHLMKIVISVIAITTLLLPLILEHAYSEMRTYEHSVTLKITNTKTGVVHTKDWKMTGYSFGKKPIDVPDFTLKKIKNAFNASSFSFTLHNKVFEGKWLYFKLELIGTPLVGKGLTVKFI